MWRSCPRGGQFNVRCFLRVNLKMRLMFRIQLHILPQPMMFASTLHKSDLIVSDFSTTVHRQPLHVCLHITRFYLMSSFCPLFLILYMKYIYIQYRFIYEFIKLIQNFKFYILNDNLFIIVLFIYYILTREFSFHPGMDRLLAGIWRESSISHHDPSKIDYG